MNHVASRWKLTFGCGKTPSFVLIYRFSQAKPLFLMAGSYSFFLSNYQKNEKEKKKKTLLFLWVEPTSRQTAGIKRENANNYTTSAKLSNLKYIIIIKQLFIDRSWIDKNTGVFLREMCSDRCKNTMVEEKYRKALAHACLMSEPLPNAANSSDMYFQVRLDSMLRELRKLLCYDKHGCFSWENVFGPPQKPWLWTEKNRRH